jgi:hypothetical protein
VEGDEESRHQAWLPLPDGAEQYIGAYPTHTEATLGAARFRRVLHALLGGLGEQLRGKVTRSADLNPGSRGASKEAR